MAGVAAAIPKYQFSNSAGAPLANGTVDVYLAGTTTRTPSYQDSALSTANANPIALDSGGYCTIWLDSTLTYKLVAKNSAGATQWTEDNVTGAGLATALTFLQAGTGAVARTVQAKLRDAEKSILDFSGDTASATQKAVDAVQAAGGGRVLVPVGVHLFGAEVNVPQNVEIVGAGWGAVVKPSASIRSLFNLTGGLASVSRLSLQNVSSFATSAVRIAKSANDLPAEVTGNYMSSFAKAILWADGDCGYVNRNTMVSNTISVEVQNDFRNSEALSNYILGGNGILVNKGAQGAEGVMLGFNKILPGAGGTYCITLNCGLEITVQGNVLDQVITGNALVVDATTNTAKAIKVLSNYMGRQAAAAGADHGLYIAGDVRSLTAQDNTYAGWRQAGVKVLGLVADIAQDIHIIGETFNSNDACVRDIQLDYAEGTVVDRCKFSGTSSIVEGTGVTGRVDRCSFGTLPVISTALRYGQQAKGLTLSNKGSATIVAAGTAVVVDHGLSYTPAVQDFTLTCGTTATDDPSPMFVTNITSTQFTISPRAAPASSVTVGWRVNMER